MKRRRQLSKRDKSVIYNVWWFDRSEHLKQMHCEAEAGKLAVALMARSDVRKFSVEKQSMIQSSC